MLYQPTNLIPSSFAGEGNDVIDASVSNVFSALLTGSSSTVWAYRLKIMQNSTGSAVMYDTGVVQLSEAFYPMNYDGQQNRLEITVPANTDPDNSMVNEYANGYKWTLTVWESYDSENPDETAVTSAEQFFWTKISSNVRIDATTAPATITSRENLWKAIYTSSSSVQWFQWTLAEVQGSTYKTVYKTNRIYGSSQIWFNYSGLVSDRTYAVQVTVTNQYGQTVTSAWAESTVHYDTVTVTGATNIQQTEDGVQVDWSGVQYIEGDALYKANDQPSDNYEILDDYPVEGQHSLDVEEDTYVRFQSSPTFNMEMSEGGTIVWAGKPDEYTGDGVDLIEFRDTNGVTRRKLRHEGFEPGLMPGQSVDSQSDEPANPLYITNGSVAANISSLAIDIDPVQLGTGTPSTNNVRPIGGFPLIRVQNNTFRYGIRWDGVEPIATERLWDGRGITLDTTNFSYNGSVNPNYDNPFDDIYPFNQMKLCNVDLDAYRALQAGEDIRHAITAWYGDSAFRDDGSNGFVGAYRPEYWYIADKDTDGTTVFGVSNGEVPNWNRIPAYIRGFGFATQGSTSTTLSCDSGQPYTNVTLADLHTYANNSGFTIDNIHYYSAELTAYLAEFGNMDAQVSLGFGVSDLYRQNASDIPLIAETGATRVVLPSAFGAVAINGATLDFGASNGAVVLANRRTCLGYEAYPDNNSYISVLFDKPLDITTSMYVSVHGLVNGNAIGNVSGYIGTNGKSTAYYRGSVMHANRWRYVLGAYRQTGTNNIWVCDGIDACDNYNALNTSVHRDTGYALPGSASAAVSGYISGIYTVEGYGAVPFATAIGGSSTRPIGDYVYVPTSGTGNTVLLVGAYSGNGRYCGPFYGRWVLSSGSSLWPYAVLPLLKNP